MSPAAKKIPEVGIDMTPMIDVVFQLLIFFMLVNHMVQVERAELELPLADKAIEQEATGTKQLVINIYKNEKIEIASQMITWKDLSIILEKESLISRDAENTSTRTVSIRADIQAPYEVIQKVMVECARQRIYKICFEAKIPEKIATTP